MRDKVKNWPSIDKSPLSCLGLISYKYSSTFLQVYALEKISKHYHDELILALIPVFVGSLVHAHNVVTPVSEYLLELAAKSPMIFGREVCWNLLSLPDFFLRRAVFNRLFTDILSICPILRRQITREKKLVDFLHKRMIEDKNAGLGVSDIHSGQKGLQSARRHPAFVSGHRTVTGNNGPQTHQLQHKEDEPAHLRDHGESQSA